MPKKREADMSKEFVLHGNSVHENSLDSDGNRSFAE